MIDLIRRTGGLAGFKAVMEWFGVDCGPVRAPLDNLTVERKNQLRADLEAIGFFQWSQRSAASDSAVADLPTEPAV
jgi:N-acetylneuraminate lyase